MKKYMEFENQIYIKSIPTKEDISQYISEHPGLIVTTEEVMIYWNSKNWKTKKGNLPLTLNSIVNVANSIKHSHSDMIKLDF